LTVYASAPYNSNHKNYITMGVQVYMRYSKFNIKSFVVVMVIAVVLLFPGGSAWAAYPMLTLGSRGEAVSRLQQGLMDQGYYQHWRVTGYYGPITRDSVIKFQRARGLVVDGIAGNATQSTLYGNNTGNIGTGYVTLKFGMNGPAVSKLQNTLKEQGYFYGSATGYYGKVTENAVIAFQKARGLRIDGIAGPQTQRALYGSQTVSNSTVSRGNTLSTQAKGDIYWLARIIHAEASGESYLGKVAVGNVILNRVKSSAFPNTVYGVIFEYYHGIPQFSPVEDGSIYNTPSSESYRAAEEAYSGSSPVGGALYFFNPAKSAGTWIVRTRAYVTTIGAHAFYR
jgi:N-acetylmuramoyl-L-alanine amidase